MCHCPKNHYYRSIRWELFYPLAWFDYFRCATRAEDARVGRQVVGDWVRNDLQELIWAPMY